MNPSSISFTWRSTTRYTFCKRQAFQRHIQTYPSLPQLSHVFMCATTSLFLLATVVRDTLTPPLSPWQIPNLREPSLPSLRLRSSKNPDADYCTLSRHALSPHEGHRVASSKKLCPKDEFRLALPDFGSRVIFFIFETIMRQSGES